MVPWIFAGASSSPFYSQRTPYEQEVQAPGFIETESERRVLRLEFVMLPVLIVSLSGQWQNSVRQQQVIS